MVKTLKIPEATIIRLSVYSRYMAQIKRKGIVTISSGEIARGVGVSSAQVRKDLAYFGEFGTRGVGYNVGELYGYLMKILGLTTQWKLVIVGAGKLGSALAMYGGFAERGFKVVGIFDNDPRKIGQKLDNLEIMDISQLPKIVEANEAKIGIIAVPAEEAQEVTNILIKNGLKAILNFSPRVLSVPDDVVLRNVDLSVNLEILSFYLDAQKR
ncbi:MAG: redox-sensing transcriptional repressor Rex [Syntrophomonadaceae bacterium]|nr:redox-sensing transcriptional repressor Rex [Syntrophomonadaceae bacterium]